MRLLDRNVQYNKMLHAALLHLMLEAVNADLVFTISLKRSTQNRQLSTSCPADYPIFRSEADINDPFATVLGAYPGRLFTAPYVLSIRYLVLLNDTAMKYLRFFLTTN